jgi:hypothetical protein
VAQRDASINEVTAMPTGEHVSPEPWFTHEMHNTATAYASSASTNVVAYEDLPGHHLLAVRNLIATTNDESYHSSASELPPLGTSHGYAEWDFSVVPDPVMFQWFLDTADYWSAASTTLAPEATTPRASASWSPSATWSKTRAWQVLVMVKPPKTRGPAYLGT